MFKKGNKAPRRKPKEKLTFKDIAVRKEICDFCLCEKVSTVVFTVYKKSCVQNGYICSKCFREYNSYIQINGLKSNKIKNGKVISDE